MKKNYLLFLFLLINLTVFISCGNLEKENCTDSGSSLLLYENYENTAVPLNLHEKSNVNNGYALTVFSGHTSNDCTGCVMVAGVLVHMDCVGGGGDCTVKASVTLSSSIDSLYNAITLYAYELTDEDIFLMPARSLFAGMNGEKEIWLNDVTVYPPEYYDATLIRIAEWKYS